MLPRALIAAIVAGFLLLFSPLAGAAGPYPPPNDESGEVNDSRVEAGSCVVFSGDGFQAGTEVTITDNGDFVTTSRANSEGEFAEEVCFDASARRGQHTLRGTGLGADGQPLTVSAVVYVTGVSQRPGTGPGRGTGTDGGDDGAGGSTGSSGVPGALPTAGGQPTAGQPSATPGPASPNRPDAGKDDKGMGVTGWLIVLALFAFLALLSSLILLAGRRRGEEPGAPA